MPILCPIAIVKSCKGCPFYNICPVKSVVGDEGKLRINKEGDVEIRPTRPKE